MPECGRPGKAKALASKGVVFALQYFLAAQRKGL
jgi:hypothetical protein